VSEVGRYEVCEASSRGHSSTSRMHECSQAVWHGYQTLWTHSGKVEVLV
jgi:hypothetical protein